MAVNDISIPLKYVYVQSTTPADLTEGKLWYNTSDNALYTSNGTNYVALDFDTSYIDQQQLEQNINILINSASASSTLNDYDEMFLDIFTSAGGELSTVDTGNTTANLITDAYENSVNSTENHGKTITSTTSKTGKCGLRITTGTDALRIFSFNKGANSTATKGYLLDADQNVLIGATSFVSNTCTFATPYILEPETDYILCVDADGASYNDCYSNDAFPQAGTLLNWTGVLNGSGVVNATDGYKDIQSCVINSIVGNVIIQTNAETITANQTHHQLFCHSTLTGTATLTYDISFDGGTTWDTNQSLNTKNVSGHTGSSMIIKLNLNGTGGGNLAKLKDYAIMLYY